MSSHLSIDKLHTLPNFLDQHPLNQSGKYVIRYEEEKISASVNDKVQSKTWFQSPPLDLESIKRIDCLQLIAESHDQGEVDDDTAGNWTWLEIAIFESERSTKPRFKDGIELVWVSHPNHFEQVDYQWAWGKAFNANHDLLRLLEDGNVIAVRLCARFPGWEIAAKNGHLVIDIGQAREKKTVNYGKIVSDVERITSIINAVNVQTQPVDMFKPAVTLPLLRADIMTTDGQPLRVLSLDGGGARGLSSLLLLQNVMDKISLDKKPCEVFDMIGGTSTGGLIAIMLGRLKMSVKDCIKEYQKVMDKVFIPRGELAKILLKVGNSQTYDSDVLENVIKDLVRAKLGDAEAPLLDESSGNTCKVFVMAVFEDAPNNRAPVYLRSYRNKYDDSLLPQVRSVLPEIKIWEAARATSAAPTYFKPITVGKFTLLDGGLGANNPLGWLWLEMWAIYGPRRSTDCFLSIGTGIPANQSLKGIGSLVTNMSSVATNTEITHILMRTLINAYAPTPVQDKYWRLNVGTRVAEWDEKQKHLFGKDTIEKHLDNFVNPGAMDDLKSLPNLIKLTEVYIKEQEVEIKQCAEKLKGHL